MPTWFHAWLALGGGIGFVWLARYAAVHNVRRKRRILSSRSYPGPPVPAKPGAPGAPKVSVIVAAKDEEDNIETCVTSLLKQDYPNYEVIVVDDRSGDRTPAILRRLQQHTGDRLRVVTVKSLREGWFGKNNAMREGVAASTGEWLLFTDADCRQTSEKTLSVAMREALAEEVDFLCITPVLETRAVWERIIQPVCAMVLMSWFLPHRVNKPERKTAYANGAFMLMRRTCYEAIGGHERVRTEVNEDVLMARFTKQMGLRLRVVENDDLYRTRMYDSLGAAWRGWSRIFYGCLGSLTRLMLAACLLAFLSIVPWVSLIAALAGLFIGAKGGVPWAWAVAAWFAVVVIEQFVTWHVYVLLRAGSAWSLTYLLGAFTALAMLLNAMLKAVGATATTWRGTTYRGRHVQEVPKRLTHQEPTRLHPDSL